MSDRRYTHPSLGRVTPEPRRFCWDTVVIAGWGAFVFGVIVGIHLAN